ncbi:MAG: hypothetical protein ABWZ02_04475 [Nakamurella sp.]
MGHCSRSFSDRPDYAARGRGAPNIGWTVIDPYRADLDPYRSTQRSTDSDLPYWARAGMPPAQRPPYVPVTPIIVIMIVLVSTAPAGLVFLPFLVFGLVMVAMAHQGTRRRHWRQRAIRQQAPTWTPPSMRPEPPAGAPSATTEQPPVARPDDEWPSRNPAVRSPFDTAAFWDEEPANARPIKPAPPTPPAWDPLGVAPFAWDLPDPPPLQPTRQRRRLHFGAAKLISVTALLAALLVTAGDFAGWWPLDWAAAAVSVLAVVAIAMIGGSARQRVRR